MSTFDQEGDAWDRVEAVEQPTELPDPLIGEVADGVLNISDPNNAFAWIELDLPCEHAIFHRKTTR